MAMEKFRIHLRKNFEISKTGCSLLSYQAPSIICLFILLFIIQNIIHKKDNIYCRK